MQLPRNLLLIILFLLFKNTCSIANGPGLTSVTQVNASDTVSFSLLQNGNGLLGITVSMLTDDTIYALDFAMKYDHILLQYDSVQDVTGYCQLFAYYNNTDSTLRATSNSLQAYGNDTSLFIVWFTLLNGTVSSNAVASVTGLLNGDACSVKITDAGTTGLIDNHMLTNIQLCPNPVVDLLELKSSDDEHFISASVFTSEGKLIQTESGFDGDIDVSALSPGYYFLHAETESHGIVSVPFIKL